MTPAEYLETFQRIPLEIEQELPEKCDREIAIKIDSSIGFGIWPRVRAMALEASTATLSLPLLLQQPLCLLQVQRIEAFREPTIDRREKIVGLLSFAPIAPKPGHA
jgi:hypothetical protein